MSKMTKLTIVHNIIAPYRMPLFTKIASQSGIDCEVIFCSETEKGRDWTIPDDMRFKHTILAGFYLSGRNGTIHINPHLFGHLVRSNPDIIITGEFSVPSVLVMFYCILYKKRFILWSDSTTHSESRIGHMKKFARRRLVTNSSACIVSGARAYEYLISLGADPGKVKQSILTFDVNKFSRECDGFASRERQLKKDLGLADKVLLYSGQLIVRKGLIYLLRAYRIVQRRMKNTSLLVLGNGDLDSQLREYSANNGLNVHFLGFIRQQELPKYYALADIFILPSLCDPWGIVINEAIAAGLPVVCSKYAGAAADLVKDGENGYIVEPRNIEILAEKIYSILEDDKRQFKMGTRSRELKNLCTIDRAHNGFMNAINHALLHGN